MRYLHNSVDSPAFATAAKAAPDTYTSPTS